MRSCSSSPALPLPSSFWDSLTAFRSDSCRLVGGDVVLVVGAGGGGASASDFFPLPIARRCSRSRVSSFSRFYLSASSFAFAPPDFSVHV